MENKSDSQLWEEVEAFFVETFDTEKHPQIDTLLFLIGVQELGSGQQKYTKDDKVSKFNGFRLLKVPRNK